MVSLLNGKYVVQNDLSWFLSISRDEFVLLDALRLTSRRNNYRMLSPECIFDHRTKARGLETIYVANGLSSSSVFSYFTTIMYSLTSTILPILLGGRAFASSISERTTYNGAVTQLTFFGSVFEKQPYPAVNMC
jgi:hypothetical protein